MGSAPRRRLTGRVVAQPAIDVEVAGGDVVVGLPAVVVAARATVDVVDPTVVDAAVVGGVVLATAAVDVDAAVVDGAAGASTLVVVASSVEVVAGARVVVVRAGVDVAGVGTTYTTATGAGRSSTYATRARRKIAVNTMVDGRRRSRFNRAA
jgi:hypothetical protein